MRIRSYVIIHDIDEDAVRAARSLNDWIEVLADGAAIDVETWDDVLTAIVWEFINAGDFSDYVTEKVAAFAALPPGMFATPADDEDLDSYDAHDRNDD